jgi:hypothetical protein
MQEVKDWLKKDEEGREGSKVKRRVEEEPFHRF